jgi:hypothetical protein
MGDDLYDRTEAESRESETPGETVERLVGDDSLTAFADDAPDVDLGFSVAAVTDGAVGATSPERGVSGRSRQQ